MLTNWRVWILTTVAAVGGAYILGVTAPVRAEVVTYTQENAELTYGDAVTGCNEFESSENENTQANITVSSKGKEIDNRIQYIATRYEGGGTSVPNQSKVKNTELTDPHAYKVTEWTRPVLRGNQIKRQGRSIGSHREHDKYLRNTHPHYFDHHPLKPHTINPKKRY